MHQLVTIERMRILAASIFGSFGFLLYSSSKQKAVRGIGYVHTGLGLHSLYVKKRPSGLLLALDHPNVLSSSPTTSIKIL